MSQTLLLEVVRGQWRLAAIEDGQLQELFLRRPGDDPAEGSILLGKMENAVPGMNAVFVDIGAEKNGFLDAGDIPGAEDTPVGKRVRPGQSILVQVSRAQSGQKGHRLTGRVTLPGRALALLPGQGSVGVSKKIAEPAERSRLREIGMALTEGSDMGLILRTAARDMDGDALSREYAALLSQWQDIEKRAAAVKPPRLLFDGDSLPLKCVRDLLNESVEAVWADGPEAFEALQACARALSPEALPRIRLYEGETPLFDLHRVDVQLEKALSKYVWLKSGGSLVIEETEAMTVIDVNTGKFTGRRNLEDTIFKINCEAAREIVRQLRLRGIGGIIVVDFIDMTDPARNEALLALLRSLAAGDRNRLAVAGMSALGLVELTRKKSVRPLSRQLLHTCSACCGDGAVFSHETTARKAVRELWRKRRGGMEGPVLIEASAPVIDWIRTIGAPSGAAWGLKRDMAPGEYVLSPTDPARLPEGCRPL